MIKRFICAIAMLILTLNIVPAQSAKQDKDKKDAQATQPRQPVNAGGKGTRGRISKWTSSSKLGDSNITEDSSGNVGIGTTLPTSPLTVEGIIETMGGIKFSDGTIQRTAGGAATNITRDNTLKGDGTSALPLGLAVPIRLFGFVEDSSGVFRATNTAPGGTGMVSFGGNGNSTKSGGLGLLAFGGSGDERGGGLGLAVAGGASTNGKGGSGAQLLGGGGKNGSGGDGLFVQGGSGDGAGKRGGTGIVVFGGGANNGATAGLAGQFIGNVAVTGTLTKGGGSFKIDHPLDPENKYLSHSFVESPDMMNIYNGNITTDHNGMAVVELPEWFDSLNRDFRYQLTVIGTFAQAIVAEKVKGNRFTIRTSAPEVEVSWQVTGIRQDGWANKNRIPVEEIKPESERGLYLHPDAFDKPEEQSIESVRHPEQMRELKQRREEAAQARGKQK